MPWGDATEVTAVPSRRAPSAIAISSNQKMLAIGYSGQSISLWNLEGDTSFGTCGKKLPSGETTTHAATALVFNPNPNISLLAASYLDGELALLDPFQDEDQ